MKKGMIFFVTLPLLTMTAMISTNSSPSITVQPEPVEVKQGNDVTLWCKVELDNTNVIPVLWQSPPSFSTRTSDCVSYVWRKYGISCGESPRWYNMTIKDAQWADKGKYRCIHSSDMGIVDLKVLVPVRDVSLTNVSNSTSEPLVLSQGVDAMLTCSTDCAYPAPKISWFENGQSFNDSAVDTTITESGCSGEKQGQMRTISTITVRGKSVEKERKESIISCGAGNVFGEKTISNAIVVTHDASSNITVQPGPVEVKQENNVTLWCQIQKQHTRRVMPVHWQLKLPQHFRTKTTNCTSFDVKKYGISCGERPWSYWWYNLTIKDVQWADKGKYRCIYYGIHQGIVDLKVLVPVREVTLTAIFNITSAPFNLSKDDAVLTCKTNCAYPAPSISWFVNDQLFNGRDSVNKTESGCTGEKEGQKITISTITVTGRNKSKIFCMALNIIGDPTVSQVMDIDNDVTTSQPHVIRNPGVAEAFAIALGVVLGLILTIGTIIFIKNKREDKKYLPCCTSTQSQHDEMNMMNCTDLPVSNQSNTGEDNLLPSGVNGTSDPLQAQTHGSNGTDSPVFNQSNTNEDNLLPSGVNGTSDPLQ